MQKDTLIVQSHRQPLPQLWLARCLNSVESWCDNCGYDYEFVGDELFEFVLPSVRDKLESRKVIKSDVARLALMQQRLLDGYATVVWCDADFLIFDAARFALPLSAYALGREVWVEQKLSKMVANVKVHNAFLMFRQGNPFLEFYLDTALRLIEKNDGAMPSQFVGPKLLTALHNVAQCPVLETAGMLSPAVLAEIATGAGPALRCFRERSSETIAAANLCSSLIGQDLDNVTVEVCIDRLLDAEQRHSIFAPRETG